MTEIVLVGSREPVSLLLSKELARQCDAVFDLPLWPPNADEGERNLPMLAHRPMIVLLTWADLTTRALDGAARAVSRRIQEIRTRLHHRNEVVICVVPYASYRDEGRISFQWLASEPVGTAEAERMAGAAFASLAACGPDIRLALAPMLVSALADESCGYPSLLQKAIRLARCLSEEVESKAPGYFTRYSLTIRSDGHSCVNAATPAQVATSLLRACVTPQDAGTETGPVNRVDDRVSWYDLAASIAGHTGVPMSFGGADTACTALDDVFNELMQFSGALSLSPAVAVPPDIVVEAAGRGEVLDEVAAVALERPQTWESSYEHITHVSLDAVDGCTRHAVALESGAAMRQPAEPMGYFSGGEGSAVVLIPPLGIDPAYFCRVVRHLLPRHRMIVWKTAPVQVNGDAQTLAEANARGVLEALRQQGADACHLVAWCGGVRVAACLMKHSIARIRSLTLMAPDICEPAQRTQASQQIAAMFARLHQSPSLADETCAQLLKSFRDTRPAAKLDQYAPTAAQRKSPLQYHPIAFDPALLDEFVRDTGRMLAIAREIADSGECVDDLVATLAAYGGPTMLMLGTNDALIPYTGVRQRCVSLGPWTVATIIGGNHYFVLEHGDAVARLLGRFVDGDPRLDEPTTRSHAGRIRIEASGLDRVERGSTAAQGSLARPMIDRTELTDAVARFVAARSGERPERIHEDFDYVDAGLIDSVGIIELLFFVQDTFARDVALGDVAVDRLNTAARVYDLVASATQPRSRSVV